MSITTTVLSENRYNGKILFTADQRKWLVSARNYAITNSWKIGDELAVRDLQDGAMRSHELKNLSRGESCAIVTLAFH